MATPRILHLWSAFPAGGRQLRAVRLMNAWGPRARHVIVSADPGRLGARAAIAADVSHEIAQDPPPLRGGPSVARFEAIARFTRSFDLVLTHDWGAIDGVMARRAFGRDAPPVIHHENGFDDDEALGRRFDRDLYRRIALGAAHALVVPGPALTDAAVQRWRLPQKRVRRIDHGVDADMFAVDARPGAIPGLERRSGEFVVGTVAGLTQARDLSTLVRAVGGVAAKVRLVVVGDGPERDAIARAGQNMGLADRLVMPGYLADPHRFLGLFDLLALSSLGPRSFTAVVEAMAAGLPVASFPASDVPDLVADENRPYLAAGTDSILLRDSIQVFASHREYGRLVGAANRDKARRLYGEGNMIARYAALYEEAMGRPEALTG